MHKFFPVCKTLLRQIRIFGQKFDKNQKCSVRGCLIIMAMEKKPPPRLRYLARIHPSHLGIAQKIGLVFLALFLIAVMNVVLVERMMTRSDQIADTVNVAGKLRMLGMRIAMQSVSYSHGVGVGIPEVRQLMTDFETALKSLSEGGHVFGLYLNELGDMHDGRLHRVTEQWQLYQQSVQRLLDEITARMSNTNVHFHTQPEPDSTVHVLVEQVAGHSALLLERTEALMTGILGEVKGARADTMYRLYWLVAFDAMLVLLAFLAVRKQIVVPLRDLSTHCVELAEGNYNTRFVAPTQDEIGHLAKVFNESALRIGRLVDQIETDRLDLQRAEAMFRGIAENSMVGVYISHKGRFLYVNQKLADMFGYSTQEMIDETASGMLFLDVEDGNPDASACRRRLEGATPGLWVEKQGRRKDGSLVELEIYGSLMLLDDEQVTIGIALDITQRKESEAQARLAMLVFRHSGEAMVVTDPDGKLLSVNPAFTRITGYEEEEVIGKRLNILSSGRHDENFYEEMWASIDATGSWEGDIWNRRKNGEVYAERLVVNTFFDTEGAPRYRIGLFSDITKQKEANAFVWRQANYDFLTGLPNRQLFHSRVEQEMDRCDATGKAMALVYLDIDDFKEVNDTLGHGVGDRLLEEAARRLQACVRPVDTVARLGGDEFMFILSDLSDLTLVDDICRRALDSLASPFLLEGERASISASMGITFYPHDAGSLRELMQNADLAMYAAKERGKYQVAHFQPSMQVRAILRRELGRDLAVALEEDQFHLVYQPIVRLQTGRIEKVECLLRWEHPHKGAVSPGVFVPFAEDSGLISRIGEWVFRSATQQVATWRRICPGLQASINVSPVQFAGQNLDAAAWLEHLAGIDMAGDQIVVEITERLLMDADVEVTQKLIAFRDAGVQIALDDFGTGYSSMSYLKRFDIDYIKIDQSFVRNLGRNVDDLVLCEAMIGMAHRLGLEVVAEGVETPLQRELLLKAGCDFAQGYLFSAPVGADEFEALLRQGMISTASHSAHHSSVVELPQRT